MNTLILFLIILFSVILYKYKKIKRQNIISDIIMLFLLSVVIWIVSVVVIGSFTLCLVVINSISL